jgi:hypothetical protein
MLESDSITLDEGSGAMLFQLLKSLLMIVPQSTSYCVLRDRLASVARFRQSASKPPRKKPIAQETKSFVARVTATRKLHCECAWQSIRQESLEEMSRQQQDDPAVVDKAAAAAEQVIVAGRRNLLGFRQEQQALANNRRPNNDTLSLSSQQQQRSGTTTQRNSSSLLAESSLSTANRQRGESFTTTASSVSSSSGAARAADADVKGQADQTVVGKVNQLETVGTSLSVDTADESLMAGHMMVEQDDAADATQRPSQEAVVTEWKHFWVDSSTTTMSSEHR